MVFNGARGKRDTMDSEACEGVGVIEVACMNRNVISLSPRVWEAAYLSGISRGKIWLLSFAFLHFTPSICSHINAISPIHLFSISNPKVASCRPVRNLLRPPLSPQLPSPAPPKPSRLRVMYVEMVFLFNIFFFLCVSVCVCEWGGGEGLYPTLMLSRGEFPLAFTIGPSYFCGARFSVPIHDQ